MMQIKMNSLKKAGPGIGLPVLAALLLTHCGGGRSGAAVHAYAQTISFGAAPALTLHGTATVSATATSGLAVNFSSTTPTVCSIDSNSGLVTSFAAGNCVIAADQAGDTNFAPAPQVTQTLALSVDPNQAITFGVAPSLTLYGHGIVSATVNSGLTPSFSSTTPAICSVNSSTGEVSDLTAGDCIIAVNQAGDASHNAAPQVSQTLSVAPWSGPVTTADAPGGVAATAGANPNTITVSFMESISSGGSPVTMYNVTSTPPGISASGTASPITLACPSTCSGYAFSVSATNGSGNSVQSTLAHVLTHYNVTATFYEPDTQPNNSIFEGSFTFDSTSSSVTNLRGALTESMTHLKDGIPMDTVPLMYQLSAIGDGTGLLVTTFALNSTNTFSNNPIYSGSDGWTPGTGSGLYYGYPSNISGISNPGNAYVRIFVNATDPTAPPTQTQIYKLAYADCTSRGMMGATCMTGTALAGYGTWGSMSGYPVTQVITKR